MNIPQKTEMGSIIEFYKEKILKEQIENYWRQKYQTMDSETYDFDEQGNAFSCFKDANKTWPKRFRQYFPELYRKEFSKAFENQTDKLFEDLKILLPNNDLVKGVLPVLIVGYVQNKNWGDLFVAELLDQQLEKTFSYDRETKLFLPPSLIEGYPRLKDEKFVPHATKTLFRAFLHPILFLFFLLQTRRDCNASLSFYTYEHLTGYLHLLSSNAETLLDKLDDFYKNKNVTVKCPLDKEIIRYALCTVLEIYGIEKVGSIFIEKEERSSLDISNPRKYPYPFSFYTFIGRLQGERNPEIYQEIDASVLNRKNLVKVAVFLDSVNSIPLVNKMDCFDCKSISSDD